MIEHPGWTALLRAEGATNVQHHRQPSFHDRAQPDRGSVRPGAATARRHLCRRGRVAPRRVRCGWDRLRHRPRARSAEGRSRRIRIPQPRRDRRLPRAEHDDRIPGSRNSSSARRADQERSVGLRSDCEPSGHVARKPGRLGGLRRCARMTDLVFLVPGRLDQLTGGYLYDRQIIEGLRRLGRSVSVIELGPNNRDTSLAELPDDATAVVDGLAFPVLEGALETHRRRLRLVALVHHALAEETGLSRTMAQRLFRLEAAVLRCFRGALCPSASTAAALRACGVAPDRIFVAPPGTAKPRRPLQPRRGRVRSLLCVASLIPRKGHRSLVAALSRLRDLDWELVFIGSLARDPGTARAVHQMVLRAGLRQRITLAGEQPPPAVMAAYRAADLF